MFTSFSCVVIFGTVVFIYISYSLLLLFIKYIIVIYKVFYKVSVVKTSVIFPLDLRTRLTSFSSLFMLNLDDAEIKLDCGEHHRKFPGISFTT